MCMCTSRQTGSTGSTAGEREREGREREEREREGMVKGTETTVHLAESSLGVHQCDRDP